VAQPAAEGGGEVAERLRAPEGAVPALARLGLQELIAAQPGDLEGDVLEGARGGVEGVVQGIARRARRHAADQARALLDADRARGVEAEVPDRGRLDPVVRADAHLFQWQAPERVV